MFIKEIESEIIEDFSMFDDWVDKYNYIIDLGKSIKLIDEQYKTERYLIKGCQSNAWLHAELVDDKIIFSGDGDAIITKGIMSLLFKVYSNQPVEQVMNADFTFLQTIGLKEHLSPNRANGLLAIIKMMKLYATAFNSTLKQK